MICGYPYKLVSPVFFQGFHVRGYRQQLKASVASTLNSRLNFRRCMTHLRLHETPNLGVHHTGSSSIGNSREAVGSLFKDDPIYVIVERGEKAFGNELARRLGHRRYRRGGHQRDSEPPRRYGGRSAMPVDAVHRRSCSRQLGRDAVTPETDDRLSKFENAVYQAPLSILTKAASVCPRAL